MKTKKLLLTVVIAAFTASIFTVEARQKAYNYYQHGYWGNIEAHAGAMLGGGCDIGVSTTHGFCIGHGLAMGIGTGLYFDLAGYYYFLNVPIFLETKYSPLKQIYSPFVSLRTGFSINDLYDTGFYLSPAIGIDYKWFSLFMRYSFNLCPQTVYISIPEMNINTNAVANVKSHAMSVGFAFNF
ncbi:MAG: hypothetical protein II991_07080 [Bacteroidales bacterium]|nr:hypothetical protein [Bacteroidales bacterium]